jgi:hypothetical protein
MTEGADKSVHKINKNHGANDQNYILKKDGK